MRHTSAIAAFVLAASGLAVSQLAATDAPATNKPNEAIITELLDYVTNNPTDGAATLKLGQALSEAGRFDEAQKWLERTAEIDPALYDGFVSVAPEGSAAARGGLTAGADVEHTDIHNITNYSAVGGIDAYSLGSRTCNIGNQSFSWINRGTPGLAMNAYRMENGRLMQVGMSWVKHACCAAQTNGCGLGCQSGGGLGPGCMDTYSSSWNGGQSRMGKRSGINAWAGTFSSPIGSGGTNIAARLQVREDDTDSALHPGALYFVEGVYVCTEDALAGNRNNNASYRQGAFSASHSLSLTGHQTQPGTAAIFAWRDHGLGMNTPDNSVNIQNVDVPLEGRFIVADKAIDNGDGTWRYEYAVFNLSSDLSGSSFSVPVPNGVNVTAVGFNDVDYHSGETLDNTDWNSSAAGGAVTWSSPQTFNQNPNTNALRWGTMYNFWFTADAGPQTSSATLGLFKPHMPTELNMNIQGPAAAPCPQDLDGDGSVGSGDLAILLGAWGTPAADLDNDNNTGSGDLAVLLGAWGPC